MGDKRVAGLRLREAFEQQYIVGPEIRKKSYRNLREYMYFANCKDPDSSYLKYREDENVIYHAQMVGFCNLWMITKDKIDIEEDIVIEGYRSDFYAAFAPDRSWEKAIQIMKKMIETFNPEEYSSEGFIQNHWNEPVAWDAKDELLYRYFKYFLRNPLSPVMKEHGISKEEAYEFLDKLSTCCTIITCYYPETLLAYDHYLFMFETDYEDFIVDLFSQVPTSSLFFKGSNKLFLLSFISKQYIKSTENQVDINKWYIPLILAELSKRKIIKSKARSVVWYSKGKNR